VHDLRVALNQSRPTSSTWPTSSNATSFYVVSDAGIDPITRRHRRRWHPADRCREDAEAIVARLAIDEAARRERSSGTAHRRVVLVRDVDAASSS
jgi:hypothetical protein